jgi:REP element-mobilizing transposase RayT
VTLRAAAGVDWLRTRVAYRAMLAALSQASREEFRVVHFSVQTNHVHLIVEADGKASLSRGMRGLAIRCALAVNRALRRRGALWADRYHARALSAPRMVRNSLIYVLGNARKHLRAVAGIDPCSSARWFDGFSRPPVPPSDEPPTRPPRTWLLRVGWRRLGLISFHDGPVGTRQARMAFRSARSTGRVAKGVSESGPLSRLLSDAGRVRKDGPTGVGRSRWTAKRPTA